MTPRGYKIRFTKGTMDKITFATLLIAPHWEQETVLFVESLRAFGGSMAGATNNDR